MRTLVESAMVYSSIFVTTGFPSESRRGSDSGTVTVVSQKIVYAGLGVNDYRKFRSEQGSVTVYFFESFFVFFEFS